MKTEEIIAGNRLLAEFMKTKSSIVNDMYFGADGILYSVENLRYHFSWDWLIPVVEKILCTENTGLDWEGYYEKIHDSLWSINIESVWLACVEFVKWWNEEQK